MKKSKIINRPRKIICFVLVICLFTGSFSVSVSAEIGYDKLPSEDGFGYTYKFLTTDTIAITDYDGYDVELNVPSKIDGYTVTSVEGIDTTKTKKIVLPDTVTTIGDSAFAAYDNFSYSVLEEITLPKNLKTIDDSAFKNCYGLKSIDIPESVTKIGSEAFYGCNNLKNITMKSDIDIGDSAFNGVPAIEYAYKEDHSGFLIWNGWVYGYNGSSKTPVIPSGVVGISDYVFRNSDITAVTISEGVKYINYSAFEQCASLKNVKLPNTLVRINGSAFKECTSLSSVTFGEGLKTIEREAFTGCEALKEIALPNGLETLEYDSFADCINLEKVTFPNTLTTADQMAFYGTKWYNSLKDGTPLYYGSVFLGFKNDSYGLSLGPSYTVKAGTKTVDINGYIGKITNFNFPDSLKSLTFSAYNVSGYDLTSLTVPESVDYVMITSQSKLKNLKLPTTAKLGYGCFEYCSALENITIPKGNARLETTLSGCSSLKKVVLADDTVELGYHALDFADNLTTVDLKNVRVIDSYAFWHCPSIQKITIPDTVTTIGYSAFSDCSSLTTVTGGKNVRILDNAAFKNCTKLTSIGSIGQNLKRLGDIVFENTKWFDNQKDGIVYLGKVAYCYKGDMPQNTTITIKDGTCAVSSGFITGHQSTTHFEQPNLVKVVLPKSCKYIGNAAFFNCTNLKSIVLGGAEIAEDDSFQANACETITFPSSMRIIGDDSFTSKVLKNVNLNDGLQAIGEGAFFSYGKIKSMKVPASVTYIGNSAIGYYPPDPDDPFTPSTTIPDFVIYGVGGTEAEKYANQNGIKFCGSKTLINSMIVIGNGYGNWLNGAYWNTYYEENYMEKISDTVYQITFKNVEQNDDCQFKLAANGLLNDTWGGVAASPGKTETAVYNSDDNITFSVDYELADVTLTVDLTDFDSVKKTGVKFRIDVVDKTPPLKVYGDVNGDGEVTIEDATIIQKEIVGFVYFDYNQNILADVDNDGEVTVFDVTLIQKYLAGGYSDTGLVGELSDIR